MFYLYQSNRLESLAALFARIQKVKPLKCALQPEQIVVQSQGMRRYLNTCLARDLGVAANLAFSLPAGLTWKLMKKLIPGIPELSPFAPEVMRWRLLDLFRSAEFQNGAEFEDVRNVLQDYLGSGESADYQLAGQLADIFDQYLVYRPRWIDAWQQGRILGLGDDEIWQSKLWRYLDDGRQSAPHRVALWEKLLAALDKDKLPERYFVFGISTMAPMYLQLLHKLSEHCDVFVFALNPSGMHWGNVIEAAQILKGGGDPDLTQAGHPLLASLGKQGRDFFDFLNEMEIEEETPVFEEGGRDTLLHALQTDIQNLKMPSENVGSVNTGDGSIRIVSAHSPLRELQILKDKLLKILHEHPDWQPHDIAVLTPNIEPYTPFIEAVFGQAQPGAQALPYSVSDVKISRRQPLFHALSCLFDLLESRFEVGKVLVLLETAPVLRRFGLTGDDLPLLHDMVADLNVRWGLDGEMRGGTDQLFTWKQAVERMILGWMLPEGGNPMWQDVSAWYADVNQTAMFGRFAAFLETLSDIARIWRQPATVGEWVARCRDLLETLFQAGPDDQKAVQNLENEWVKWQEESTLAGFFGQLPQQTVIRHIRRFLDSESEAGFLRGGITFCSMVPMRSLPFKVICLLGLNDGDFPRNTKAAVFDLVAKHPAKGDRARRDDDRYLFLEALISAREILYLSYIGRDIRKDEELAPSSLLGELIDTVAAMTGTNSRQLAQNWIEQHPLQAFSRRYFQEGGRSDGIFGTRTDYAAALGQTPEPPRPFFDQPVENAEPVAEIGQDEFIRFWRNPVKVWLQQQLAWSEPHIGEAWEPAEPFDPQHADQIAETYIEARREGQDFAQTAARIGAESLLPSGELGRLWQQDFQTAAKQIDTSVLNSPKLPPFPYAIPSDGQILKGSLGNLYRCGQVFYAYGKPNAPQRVAFLLEHLIFCAVMPSEAETRQTFIVQSGETEVLAEIAQDRALQLLSEWMAFFNIGQNRPLPFFAKTSLAAAEAFAQKQDWEAALKKAQTAYYGSKVSKGQKDYTEVALVFGNASQNPLEQPLFENLARLLADTLAVAEKREGTGEA
ncbi:TPA: exodeoxyribonuclease V subunit gamma [Neisseria gonorrhoeae]